MQPHRGFLGREEGGHSPDQSGPPNLLWGQWVHQIEELHSALFWVPLITSFSCFYLPMEESFISSGRNFLIRVLFLLKTDVLSLVERMWRKMIQNQVQKAFGPGPLHHLEVRPQCHQKRLRGSDQWRTGSRVMPSRIRWAQWSDHWTWQHGKFTI